MFMNKTCAFKWQKKQIWLPPEPLRRDFEFGTWSAPILLRGFLNFPTSTPARALSDSLSEPRILFPWLEAEPVLHRVSTTIALPNNRTPS